MTAQDVPDHVKPSELLSRVARSEHLRSFKKVAEQLTFLKPFLGEVLEVRIIVDAEFAQRIVRWRLRRRKKPSALTSIEEAISSGSVVAIAPLHLDDEIEEHIQEIATSCAVSVDIARHEWMEVRKRIRVVEGISTAADENQIDPDDAPYVELCKQIEGAVIYSKDRHYRAMGAPVISVDLDLTLRDYARAASFALGMKLGYAISVSVGIEAFVVLAQLLRSVASLYRGLPPWCRVTLAILVLVAFLHPKSRSWIIGQAKAVVSGLAPVGRVVAGTIGEAAVLVSEADTVVESAQTRIQALLPRTGKHSALTHVRAVCLSTGQPLSLAEIQARILANGYSWRSPRFRDYLRRQLRRDPWFNEVGRDVWEYRIYSGIAASADTT
jgi:hypothetical protein